jgi:hypothetical protein
MGHELAAQLAAAAARRDVATFEPTLLEAAAPETAPALVALLAIRPSWSSTRSASSSSSSSRAARPASALRRRPRGGRAPARRPRAGRLRHVGLLSVEPRLVHVLPEPLHRELRLDRNRYAITTDEQERLTGLCVAVAGLSVGRAVVSTMAHEGVGGELRLADFDVLELSNLNRVVAASPTWA